MKKQGRQAAQLMPYSLKAEYPYRRLKPGLVEPSAVPGYMQLTPAGSALVTPLPTGWLQVSPAAFAE